MLEKKIYAPGIYNITNDDYHDDSAISRSGMMMFAQSPYLYWANYISPDRPEKKSTKAMDFGTAFHTFILEYDLFAKYYCIEPILEKLPFKLLLKNVGREDFEANKAERSKIEFINERIKEEFEEKANGKIILSGSDYNLLQEMRDALFKHSEAIHLIEGAKYEQSYFWQDKESGLMVKCRPDILHQNMIVDLKTCVSASYRAYQRAMADEGYHVQAAIVREGVKAVEGRDIPNCINICSEKSYPYQVGIKVISESALEIGRKQFKDILMRMRECFETNVWPSYSVEEVELPSWSL